MHSIRHSRGRIVFEVLCVLAVSASCVGAWMQTGASALLAAAIAALVYGVVHLFDMAGPRPVEANAPQRTAFDNDQPEETSAAVMPDPVVEQAAPAATATRPRKARAKRASAPKDAKVIELSVPVPVDFDAAVHSDEVRHLPLAPLFEPVPVVRQQRTLFGRKAG